jgi:NAD(P)-dependent dehydrogenase (short-subunit alcohol dehydrogenase family)
MSQAPRVPMRRWRTSPPPARSDITDQAAVRATVEEAAQALGALDLVVNAAAAYGGTRTGVFGGGPIADAAPDAFDSWSVAPARSAFAFLSGAGGALAPLDRPATLIQVTGGSSRRAMPGRGLWAAGAFGVRAITQAAALERGCLGRETLELLKGQGSPALSCAAVVRGAPEAAPHVP